VIGTEKVNSNNEDLNADFEYVENAGKYQKNFKVNSINDSKQYDHPSVYNIISVLSIKYYYFINDSIYGSIFFSSLNLNNSNP
jgi:hypothetical protein